MDTKVSAEELIYLYGFIPTKEYESKPALAATGIDSDYHLDFHVSGDITVAACVVKEAEFNEEALKDKVEDMKWLQEKAVHHHQIVSGLHENYTMIPLKFGTIYKNEDSLEQTIAAYGDNINQVFKDLSGREEWSLKIYVDKGKFEKNITIDDEEIAKQKQEMEALPRGKQFFAKKKIDKVVKERMDTEIDHFCQELHKKVEDYSINSETKKNWEKKLTERTDDMCWNGAYLIPADDVEKVQQLVDEKRKESEQKELGFVFEMSGPWPPYHFANFAGKEK